MTLININRTGYAEIKYLDIIDQLIENGADVINCSWGRPGYANQVLADHFKTECSKGRDGKGTVVVFAAGNNPTQGVLCPGNLVTNAIRVGSTNSSGTVSDFSARGPELDVVAPGENVYALTTNTSFGTVSGTSFAAPHVAGLACLILSVRPDLTAAQVKQLIVETAGRSTHSNDYGWGLINAQYAIDALMHKFAFTALPNTVKFTRNNEYTFTLSGVPRGATTQWSAVVGRLQPQSATNRSATFTYPGEGKYQERVSATITYMGRTSTITFSCTVESPAEITAIELDPVNQFDGGELYIYAVCSKLHPELTWEIIGAQGSFQLEDFPLYGDANYIDTGDQYATLRYNGDLSHEFLSPVYYPWCKVRVYWDEYGEEYTATIRWDGRTWTVDDGSSSGLICGSTDPGEETESDRLQSEV